MIRLAGALTLLTAVAMVAGVSLPAAAADSPWRIEPTPSPAVANGSLTGVSCTSATACTAVGSYENGTGGEAALAQRRDGTAWVIQPVPEPAGVTSTEFSAVSCTAPDACTAVGAADSAAGVVQTLAERWDGQAWSVQATPDPAGATLSELAGVSCASAHACTAVGYFSASPGVLAVLAETWDGQAWSVQAAPVPAGTALSQLLSVSCPSAQACVAAGSAASGPGGPAVTLVEAWNGTAWTVQPTPDPGDAAQSSLTAVSCTAPGACTAVGSYINTNGTPQVLAERSDGAAWAIQPTPDLTGSGGSGLAGVSCPTATACTAAGYATSAGGMQVTLAEAWDGQGWSVQGTPSPATSNSSLNAVSCLPGAACAAVGSAVGTGSLSLAETWNGSRWAAQTTPDPGGARPSTLAGVACPSAGTCTAVGWVSDVSDNLAPLAEARTGARWSIRPVPEPAGTVSAPLLAISCSAADACTAVGFDETSSADVPLAERWNGSGWSVQAVPRPGPYSQFASVSCPSARACVAVGSYNADGSPPVPFAETWDGTRWTAQAVPDPAGSGELLGVSCASADACTAVGDGDTDIWNGTSWRYVPAAVPAGSSGTTLSAVSCTAPDACTATGTYTAATTLTLAERWNGATWTVQPTPNADGGGVFTAVSCASATACTAVAGNFAEAWDGAGWHLQATPAVPVSYVDGVSCTAAGCTAVGTATGTVIEAFGAAAGTNVTFAAATSG
jgi:hypothetical protein